MFSERVTWAGLKCYVLHGVPAGQQPSLAVIFCHGYGAPGTDLVPLAEALWEIAPELKEKVAFIFPAGLHSLEDQGMLGGRSWWPLDLDRLLRNRTPERLQGFRQATPLGLAQARERMLALAAHVQQQFGLTRSQLVLGGFSQGAMLATDTALHLPTPPAALCILSGAMICQPEWEQLARQRGPLRVLQSHGRFDQILLFSEGICLRDALAESGAQVEFVEFPGEHGIPHEVMQRLAALLVSLSQAE